MNVYYIALLKMLHSTISGQESKSLFQPEDINFLACGKKHSRDFCGQINVSGLSTAFVKAVAEKAISDCPGDVRVWNLYENIASLYSVELATEHIKWKKQNAMF